MTNEAEWTKMIFLLADMQEWMDTLFRSAISELEIKERKKLFRNQYHITPVSLAHILERHYYKIARFPGCGKFTISVPEILHWIKEGSRVQPTEMKGSVNTIRTLDTLAMIGHDRHTAPTTILTIITDNCGTVKTAFPGAYDGYILAAQTEPLLEDSRVAYCLS